MNIWLVDPSLTVRMSCVLHLVLSPIPSMLAHSHMPTTTQPQAVLHHTCLNHLRLDRVIVLVIVSCISIVPPPCPVVVAMYITLASLSSSKLSFLCFTIPSVCVSEQQLHAMSYIASEPIHHASSLLVVAAKPHFTHCLYSA
jgi:hypothetical protein